MGVKGSFLDEGGEEDTSGLTLTVTVGGIGGGTSRGESRDTTLLPPTDWFLN